MSKGTEIALRKELKERNLSGDMIDRLVKSEIAAGTITPASAKELLGLIPTDALVKSAAELEKAAGVKPPDADPIAKTGDFGADAIGRLTFVEEVAKSSAAMVESVVDYQKDVFPTMLRAQQAQGMTLQGLVDAVGHVFGMLDGIQKSMREPIPPAGATAEGGGKKPLKHPSEQPVDGDPIAKSQAGADGKKPEARVTPINASVLRGMLIEERDDLIQKGGQFENPQEKQILKLGSAIVALESGERSDSVVKRFGIKFEAPAAAAG